MGDDDHFPVGSAVTGNGSSAANTYFINYFGKPGAIIVVVVASIAFGLSIGALTVAIVTGRAANDVADRAERESRMAEYYINELDRVMVEQGIRKAGENYSAFKQHQKE